MSRARKVVIACVAAPLAVLGVLVVAWGADAWASTDRVARNVVLSGVHVGHHTTEELQEVISGLSESFPETAVVIDAGEFSMETTAGEIGLSIDAEATEEAVFAAGRDDPLPTRPVRWLRSLFGERRVDAVLDDDPASLTWTVALLEGDRRTQPVEPTLELDGDTVSVVPGEPGRRLTLNAVVAALPTTLDQVGRPITVRVDRTVTEPEISDQRMQELADTANFLTGGTITLVAGSKEAEVDSTSLRPAFSVVVDSGGPRLVMGDHAAAELLQSAFRASPNPTGVRFDIGAAGPVPVGGEDASVCCEPGAAQLIVDAVLAGERRVELPTRSVTAEQGREWAAGLGVREVIGSFTTNHPCCQSRVTNIHRMADLLRGVLIPPGSTFSVNDTVGRRTVEKGFVEGGVIQDGEFTTDIGGGVSQFATTLFNAAFFGGLDIPVYKAHSKYISRYPFGREATLAYPSVDLRIRNDTDYGIVVWPSYTGTSITVDLWSTRTAFGEQTGQSKSSGCGNVTTERTRTFTDGRVETDTFRATYDCD